MPGQTPQWNCCQVTPGWSWLGIKGAVQEFGGFRSVVLCGPRALHGERILHLKTDFIFLARLGSKTLVCYSRAWLSHVLHCTSLGTPKLGWKRAGLNQSNVLGCGVMSRSLDKELGVL